MGMASCKDCKHYPMCGFSKYTKTPEKCLDFWDVSDVVKVVRCKDCKHWMYGYDNVGLCVTDVPDIDGVQRLDIDFCSYGERKGNEKR